MAAETFVIPIVAGIGNALMAEPMVRQLRAQRKDATVRVIAATKAMGEPFRRVRGVEVTVAGQGAVKLFAAFRTAGTIDWLIVPFPSNRWQYNVLAWRSGAKQVLMHRYPQANRAWLSGVGQRIDATRGLHDVEQNLRLLEALQIKPDFSAGPRFEVWREDKDAATDLLRQSGIDDRRPFVAVHAGSAKTILAAAKRWPADRYTALIERMLGETRLQVIVLEGPDERGVAAEIVARVKESKSADGAPHRNEAPGLHIVSLAGSLGVAGAILQRAKLYVGTDSGLAHLAGAVGTRAVTLFAPADPGRVCPFGQRQWVIQPNKPCSPCFLYPWESTKPKMRCREPYCVNEISVETVMQKVRAAVERS